MPLLYNAKKNPKKIWRNKVWGERLTQYGGK